MGGTRASVKLSSVGAKDKGGRCGGRLGKRPPDGWEALCPYQVVNNEAVFCLCDPCDCTHTTHVCACFSVGLTKITGGGILFVL